MGGGRNLDGQNLGGVVAVDLEAGTAATLAAAGGDPLQCLAVDAGQFGDTANAQPGGLEFFDVQTRRFGVDVDDFPSCPRIFWRAAAA